MKPLVIYHGNCADGFGAAWVVWRYFKGEADFYSGVYQNEPPDVTDRHVLFVDFCYKRPVMLALAEKAKSVLVLDHHKSAAEDMQQALTTPENPTGVFQVPPKASWEDYRKDLQREVPSLRGSDRETWLLFDMERSGAGLTWDFFNPGVPRPKLIDHIEDRDLWRFKLDGTREIQAALFSYPYDFSLWEGLMESNIEFLRRDGESIERKHHKDIAELVQVVTRPVQFKIPLKEMLRLGLPLGLPVVVPAANLPYTMTSDAGHLLCERDLNGKPFATEGAKLHPFAACYWITPEGVVFSLRSRDDGADVSEIAKLYGGGGHAHAAGFRVSRIRLSEFEV